MYTHTGSSYINACSPPDIDLWRWWPLTCWQSPWSAISACTQTCTSPCERTWLPVWDHVSQCYDNYRMLIVNKVDYCCLVHVKVHYLPCCTWHCIALPPPKYNVIITVGLLLVCLSVCLLATLHENFRTDLCLGGHMPSACNYLSSLLCSITVLPTRSRLRSSIPGFLMSALYD